MRPLALAAAAVLVAVPVVLAHQDDPKALDIKPGWKGPSWRAGEGVPLPAGGQTFPALNISLRSWITLPEFQSPEPANDCWGYVSPSGREYAIMGLYDGTAWVDITDPDNAQIVAKRAGNDSVWRDIKTHGHHAYVVTEANGGIQVFDLSQIDAGQVTLVNTITTGGTGNSHNVAINEASGRLYRCGGGGLGLRIYDLANPANPSLVGQWNVRYVHDAQIVTMDSGPWAGREIAFCCSGFNNGWVETGLDILDVTDPANVIELGRLLYDNGVYSHQGWLSEDRTKFYLGDELDEGTNGITTKTVVIDVTDLENPVEIGSFTNANPATGHNMYTHQGLLFQANYSSGLRVFDVASDPVNPPEVAYFDSRPEEESAGYSGQWSTYPYFPSGTVISSDRQRGLLVFRLELGPTEDLDGDGAVGFGDLLLLLADWGPCPVPPADCPADFDGSGAVDFADLLQLLAAWS